MEHKLGGLFVDVITIGETMVLFTPESTMRYSTQFNKKIGGAESNVAIGLARLGHQAGWISRLGDDEFGKAILSFVRGEGVDVSQVKMDDSAQTAIYFKELRRSNDIRVQYYRKNSAASRMSANDLDPAYISKAKYLHLTGITPALSDSCHEMILRAIAIAKKHGIKIVFDPNLRRKLWSEERARKVLLDIAIQSDIFLPGVSEGEFLTGEKDPKKIGEFFLKQGVPTVVIKVGAQGAYYATNEEYKHVAGFHVNQVVDPVGAGDGFSAGLISGLLDQLSLHKAVERGNAVGALVTMINGDVEGLPTREEIEAFVLNQNEEIYR